MKFTIFTEFDPVLRYTCSIAAAVLGGAALSAGASIIGSSNAADAQRDAANASIANSQAMYNQNKQILQPFITGGTNALSSLTNWTDPTSGTSPLASLLKLVTPGADMSSVLAQTPGYQFTQGQGQRAALNALAARGLGGSPGAIAKGVANYTSGLASSTWDSVVKNLLSTFGSETNALQGIVSTGANAGGALAGQGTASASQINSALTGAGNASAASSNAIGSAVGNFGSSIPTSMLLQQLMGGAGGGGSIYGGTSANPLSGLSASDYGVPNVTWE